MRLTAAIHGLVLCVLAAPAGAQSIEGMTGTEGVFADVQFLKEVVAGTGVTAFSRSRALVSYDNEADLFSAAYLSYTSPLHLGATLVGRVQGAEAGGDGGLHYFWASRRLVVFALAAAEMRAPLGVSWFSIARFRQPIGGEVSLYVSAELFSMWRRGAGHVASVERMRFGMEWSGWAGGAAVNAGQAGRDWTREESPGIFVRREL